MARYAAQGNSIDEMAHKGACRSHHSSPVRAKKAPSHHGHDHDLGQQPEDQSPQYSLEPWRARQKTVENERVDQWRYEGAMDKVGHHSECQRLPIIEPSMAAISIYCSIIIGAA